MLAIPGAWAVSFPGHALPPPISLATSFNLVCLLASPVPQPSVSPAPLAPASPFRPAEVRPATTQWPCPPADLSLARGPQRRGRRSKGVTESRTTVYRLPSTAY